MKGSVSSFPQLQSPSSEQPHVLSLPSNRFSSYSSAADHHSVTYDNLDANLSLHERYTDADPLNSRHIHGNSLASMPVGSGMPSQSIIAPDPSSTAVVPFSRASFSSTKIPSNYDAQTKIYGENSDVHLNNRRVYDILPKADSPSRRTQELLAGPRSQYRTTVNSSNNRTVVYGDEADVYANQRQMYGTPFTANFRDRADGARVADSSPASSGTISDEGVVCSALQSFANVMATDYHGGFRGTICVSDYAHHPAIRYSWADINDAETIRRQKEKMWEDGRSHSTGIATRVHEERWVAKRRREEMRRRGMEALRQVSVLTGRADSRIPIVRFCLEDETPSIIEWLERTYVLVGAESSLYDGEKRYEHGEK